MTIGFFELFELELATLLICVLIAFLGGVIRGFTGFAGSLFMLPCYILLLGPIPGMNKTCLARLSGFVESVRKSSRADLSRRTVGTHTHFHDGIAVPAT